ncbi:hypothetical protein KIH31_15105 [Paenarthrobacter sp. DKR-5]|uniref:hypothetical protein n=1 Tax=Paenarthrobacter sp. DKR-5 TaxID=2835535 RepID=UPI001BDD39DB|nr:hypothetical protein [Paenarthrobacter sp. DKR-5]MBT1003922.1 hypothetical protein [Paenarthrobacter sp. DKR-5]
MNQTPVNETDRDAFARLEELARTVAAGLAAEGRPFDSYPAAPPAPAKARGIFKNRRNPTKTPRAWRLHSLRLSETWISSNEPGTPNRFEQTDDELWLTIEGTLTVMSFRYETHGSQNTLTSTTTALNPLTAARYDAKPAWKEQRTVRGTEHIHETWLEMLGKPWYQKPFTSITDMLTNLQTGTRTPSGIFSRQAH